MTGAVARRNSRSQIFLIFCQHNDHIRNMSLSKIKPLTLTINAGPHGKILTLELILQQMKFSEQFLEVKRLGQYYSRLRNRHVVRITASLRRNDRKLVEDRL